LNTAKHRQTKPVHGSDNQELILTAPTVILQWCTTKYESHLQMALNEIKKESQIAGKGHNVIFEIAIPMKHTSAAKNDIDGHVPENGDTCQFTKLRQSEEECVSGLQLMSKEGRIN
jgi:hypothetical protein